jgi:hypothetical protein
LSVSIYNDEYVAIVIGSSTGAAVADCLRIYRIRTDTTDSSNNSKLFELMQMIAPESSTTSGAVINAFFNAATGVLYCLYKSQPIVVAYSLKNATFVCDDDRSFDVTSIVTKSGIKYARGDDDDGVIYETNKKSVTSKEVDWNNWDDRRKENESHKKQKRKKED